MKRCLMLFLLSATILGCHNSFTVRRLRASESNLPMADYADAIVSSGSYTVNGRSVGNSPAQSALISAFNESGYLNPKTRDDGYTAVKVYPSVKVSRSEKPVYQAMRRILLSEPKPALVREGSSKMDCSFRVTDIETGKHIVTKEYSEDGSKESVSYNLGTQPGPVDYLSLESGWVGRFASDFVDYLVPHYDNTRYPRFECKHMPQVQKGISSLQSEKFKDAEKHFRNALEDGARAPKKERSHAHLLLGLSLEKQRKFSEAQEEYQKALDLMWFAPLTNVNRFFQCGRSEKGIIENTLEEARRAQRVYENE